MMDFFLLITITPLSNGGVHLSTDILVEELVRKEELDGTLGDMEGSPEEGAAQLHDEAQHPGCDSCGEVFTYLDVLYSHD